MAVLSGVYLRLVGSDGLSLDGRHDCMRSDASTFNGGGGDDRNHA